MDQQIIKTMPRSHAHTISKHILRGAAFGALFLLVALATAWGVLALYYFDLSSQPLRTALAVLFGVLGITALVALFLPRWRRRGLAGFALAFAGLLVWWSTIEPSNHRDWK